MQQTYRCAVYAFVHCGEGGSALDMLEKMNAAGFTPAMTVPEVLIKVKYSLCPWFCNHTPLLSIPSGEIEKVLMSTLLE